jgi:arabinofuranan 3-O-arabinosyltransferase
VARDVTLLLPVVVVVAVAAGPIAIVVPVLAVVGGWRPRWLPYIAAAAMLLTGVLVATSRVQTALGNGPFSGTAQALALIALTAALMPAVVTRLRN